MLPADLGCVDAAYQLLALSPRIRVPFVVVADTMFLAFIRLLIPSSSIQDDGGQINTFATFTVASTNEKIMIGREEETRRAMVSGGSSRVAVTPLVPDAISPVWDYQRYACLPTSLLSPGSMVINRSV